MNKREIPSETLTIAGHPTHWEIDGCQARNVTTKYRMAEYRGHFDDVWGVFARDIRKGKYDGCSIVSATSAMDTENDDWTVVTVIFSNDAGGGPSWGGMSMAEKDENWIEYDIHASNWWKKTAG